MTAEADRQDRVVEAVRVGAGANPALHFCPTQGVVGEAVEEHLFTAAPRFWPPPVERVVEVVPAQVETVGMAPRAPIRVVLPVPMDKTKVAATGAEEEVEARAVAVEPEEVSAAAGMSEDSVETREKIPPPV